MLLYLGVIGIALTAYRLKKLTKLGACASIVVGIAICYGFGLSGLLLLAAFFISSSALSSIFSSKDMDQMTLKGNQRDEVQVLANGGVAAAIAVLYAIDPSDIYQVMFIASLAAANSDTWASEIGKLSKSLPFHVLSFKRVSTGTSGAVTLLGTLAAFAGSTLIASGTVLFSWSSIEWQFPLICAIIVAGFVGNLTDTVLGATIQVSYKCDICDQTTEKLIHCGQNTVHKDGLTWVTNDTVNALCTVMGAITGAGFAYMIL
ncbi:DUF92 domain-containing protein [Alkalicoccobacillus porphyridii]|uniref:DUF92 domain-containing protein n=1 Tax=Alkalicoccobacillus porphyridii TaxID=2597270 RepID=A0A553ZZI0_9BACI|nr:DUF92 domain-containing protein [Alkalicoccobacillus porphyridii]